MFSDDWRLGAVCAHQDPEVFFAKGKHLQAKTVCARCPVIDACLKDALDDEIEYGVWGGATVPERLTMLRDIHGDNYGWPRYCVNGGHLLSEGNILFTAEGTTRCRECKRERDAESYGRRRGVAA